MDTLKFYSHGKLLITGEYLVLDGAKALAIPTKFGQQLEVTPVSGKHSTWTSYDHQNQIWLNIEFDLFEVLTDVEKGTDELEKRLFQILKEIYRINPNVLTQNFNFKTKLEFPRNWGLGTSSTLIANLAKWAKVNPYHLLANTFGGSGYDIACAGAETPIVYRIQDRKPQLKTAELPEFLKPYLYFVYLGKKQNSREAIANYKNTKPASLNKYVSAINSFTEDFQQLTSFDNATSLIDNHEDLLSKILKISPVKSRLFADFDGSVKSLGAWGGDFIMALSKTNPKLYFQNKGYNTILQFEEMALNN